ncbi:MAG: cytochrome c biogenesis CcdA family protein [Thermoplasmata archaeon]
MASVDIGPHRGRREETSYRRSRALFILIILAATSVLLISSAVGLFLATKPRAALAEGVQVFYNEACGDCTTYVREVLLPTLQGAGYEEVQLKDYINVREHREEFNALNDAFEVPYSLRSHLATFISDGSALVLQGHIPEGLLDAALELQAEGRAEVLLIYQDSMDEPTSYKVWSAPMEAVEYDITTPPERYFEEAPGLPAGEGDEWAFASLVLMSGLLDGLNPCAIAILLFFISFLYVARRPRGEVLQMGVLYIYAIYLTYFLIGLGLMRAIVLAGGEHFLARVGAYLVIALGLLTIGGLYVKPLGAITRTPHFLWERAKPYLMRATIPSAFAGGLLVGLCTFPCSGGIYVAILGLLSSRSSYLGGLGYLYLYNLMFIIPLVIILVAVNNRTLSRKLAVWETTHRSIARLSSALLMIVIGLIILLFFV